jgi:radical SAM-linked protein
MRFDQWKDKFNFEVWTETIKEAGFDLDFYVYRRRNFDEVLPWQHINLGVDNKFLYNDYMNGIKETANAVLGKEKQITKLPENISSVKKEIFETKNRVLLKFSRKGFVKYVSQLEQIDFFRRALKRTTLPLAYTNGFSPQVKAAFGPAIAVGYESDSEYVDLSLTEKVDIDKVKVEISSILPKGYDIIEAKYIPLKFPSIEGLVNLAKYTIKGVTITQNYIDEYLKQDKILISKIKKGKETIIDAKELIKDIIINDDTSFSIFLRFFSGKNIKLEKILQNLLKKQENEVKILYTKRESLFIENKELVYEL